MMSEGVEPRFCAGVRLQECVIIAEKLQTQQQHNLQLSEKENKLICVFLLCVFFFPPPAEAARQDNRLPEAGT